MLSFLNLISLSLFLSQLFFIPFPVLYANEFNRYNFSHPRQEAERLISSFNLFPITDINIAKDITYDPSLDGSITNEKEFRFPNILPTPTTDPSAYAGFYQVPGTEGSRLFYYFFTSQNPIDKRPVVLWLTGGPGCSSSMAVFYENGPYRINDDLSLTPNRYGWNTLANMIFIDQPIGTGYSAIADKQYLKHDEDGVARDLDGFLQAFFKKHDKLAENEFFITGESYAGHYLPALAFLLNERNNEDQGGDRIKIQLKGIAIGNGLTDPIIQYQAYAQFASDKGLINRTHYETMMAMFQNCKGLVQTCDTWNEECLVAFNECNLIFQYLLKIAGNINYYDIRKICDGPQCYNFSSMVKYLNTLQVIDALGVGNTEFLSCSKAVYEAMEPDWMKNLEVKIPTLLEHSIKVLIYAGVEDLICNWLGNFEWVEAMHWEYKEQFQSKLYEPFEQFEVGNEKKGELIREGPLIFFKMFGAGHMVPMDQPEASWYMFSEWLGGSLGGLS